MPGLEEERIDADRDPIALLAGASTVVAIGPLTNVAEAVETSGHRIRRVVLMGGAFPGKAEHNIESDIDAAAAVFGSGVPVTAIGLDQTERVRITADALDRIAAAGPLGELLALEARQWWRFTEDESNVPHDPLAVLMLARPDLFRLTRGQVEVGSDGRTHVKPHPTGTHAVVADLSVPTVTQQIVERMIAAGTHMPLVEYGS
jgi:purine nucleosidase